MSKNLLVIVIGPTAIGKTKTTIELAKHFNSEIISCDSRQFYKEMTIGSAVPTQEELNSVPHHFIQNKSIFEKYTVGDYEKEAKETLTNIFKIKQIAFLTGGSGLFEKAVTEGLDNFPTIPDKIRENLEQLLKENGLLYLQNLLKEKDLAYYNSADINNPRRLIRALEVCLHTQQPFSSYLNKKNQLINNFKLIKIGLSIPREQLYININERVEKMLQNGLLEEVIKLKINQGLNTLNTVGYKELFDYLDNKISLIDAVEEIKKNTRRYAKRQLTWYKKDEAINWFNPNETNKMITYIKEYINS